MAFEVKSKPQYDSRKSFYGKAKVETKENGDKVLISYNTEVAEIKNGKPIVHSLYSGTTTRHIKEFLMQNGFDFKDSKDILTRYGEKANKSYEAEKLNDETMEELTGETDDAYAKRFEKSSISSTPEGARVFKINSHMEIIAEAEKTRNGFRHVARLFVDGQEVDKSKANYLNRTWESYEFQSVVDNLIEKTSYIKPEQKKELENEFQQISHGQIESNFETIANVAQLGEVFADTKKDKNAWKLRMIKAGLGEILQLPNDWESLSEKEKGKRLDLVIKTLKKEE